MKDSAKFKVLHVIDSFDLGGAQTALLNMTNCRDQDRFEVQVASMHGRGVNWDNFAACSVPTYSLSPSKYFPLYLLRLTWLIIQHRFDIIHCHLFGSNILAKPLAALLGVRVRISHDQCNDLAREASWLLFLLDKWTNRCSSHICAVSSSIKRYLVDREKVQPWKVSVVFNGVDLKRFQPVETANSERKTYWRIPSDAQVVAGIGRLHAQKNFSLFLEIAASLTKEIPNLYFVIAGTGPEEDKLKSQALDAGIADRVKFLGYVADTRPVLEVSNLLLLTSIYEGLPLTVLEAMAMRVPVVASNLDGLAEILEDGVDSYLVESGDCTGFVSKITTLLKSDTIAKALADAAYDKVLKRFSAQKMTSQVESIYIDCLGRKR